MKRVNQPASRTLHTRAWAGRLLAIVFAAVFFSDCLSEREDCRQKVDETWGDICADFLLLGVPAYQNASTRPVGDAFLLGCLQSLASKSKCNSKSSVPTALDL